MNRFGREQQELPILDVRVDITRRDSKAVRGHKSERYLLAVATSWNDASDQALQYSCHLPSSSTALSVTKEALLGDNGYSNGYSISRRTTNHGKYIIPDAGLVLFL